MSASHHQGNLRYNSNNGNKFRAADTNDINSNSTAPPGTSNRRGRNLVDLIQEVKKKASLLLLVLCICISFIEGKKEKSSCIFYFFLLILCILFLLCFVFVFCKLYRISRVHHPPYMHFNNNSSRNNKQQQQRAYATLQLVDQQLPLIQMKISMIWKICINSMV